MEKLFRSIGLLILLCFSLEANEQIYQRTFYAQKNVPGWCSKEKSQAMVDLVLKVKPSICVEIGVFGGSSILPTAFALKHLKHGKIYGIDPWKTEEAVKFLAPVHAKWWGSLNLEEIYQGYIHTIKSLHLEKFVKTLKMTSQKAAQHFKEIDILHIDGNHSGDSPIRDVALYFPKVRSGGYIWMDDVMKSENPNKPTRIALRSILDSCELICEVDKGNCILLRKK
ncbi:MAG: class I SAM-dependent methyltransferase [Simkaniaceae bacterium]|nr:class I SAM-dependent methyltransferase [Simkaniaceae bacterium]